MARGLVQRTIQYYHLSESWVHLGSRVMDYVQCYGQRRFGYYLSIQSHLKVVNMIRPDEVIKANESWPCNEFQLTRLRNPSCSLLKASILQMTEPAFIYIMSSFQ
jgi:hypothetical protein